MDLKTEFIKNIRHALNNYNRKQILQGAGKAAHVVRKISEYTYGGKRLEALKSRPTRTLRRWQSSATEDKSSRKNESDENAIPKNLQLKKRVDTV